MLLSMLQKYFETEKRAAASTQTFRRGLIRISVMIARYVNGDSKQVLIAASPMAGTALFISRDAKGHKGIKGTPIEKYVGILVHDHDVTFYNYGLLHQECAQHILRYLVGSMQNEPQLKWNSQMHSLFQKMIHYKNGLGLDDINPGIAAGFEKKGMTKSLKLRVKSTKTNRRVIIIGKDITFIAACSNTKTAFYCSCMTNGFLPTIPSRNGLQGRTRESSGSP